LPKELYSEKLADWQLYIYLGALVALISGILTGKKIIVEAGAFLLIMTSILYNINVFKIIFHKVNVNTEKENTIH
jgi:hypothetical protein